MTYELYSQFSCKTDCIDKCCKATRWTIPIDADTLKIYSEIAGDFGNELCEAINSSNGIVSFRAKENGYCAMYGEDGLCRIQKNMGHDKLCKTCQIYPRGGYTYNGILHLILSLSCPEATRLLLFNEVGLSFVVGNEERKDLGRETDSNRSIEKIGYSIRGFCAKIIQNRTVPLASRLVFLTLVFKSLLQISLVEENSQKFNDVISLYTKRALTLESYNDLLSLRNTLLTTRTSFYKQLYEVVKWFIQKEAVLDANVEFYNQINRFYEHKDHIKYSDIERLKEKLFDQYYDKHEYVFENYLINSIFCDRFPMHEKGLETAYLHTLLDYAILQVFIIALNYDKDKLEDSDVLNGVYYFSLKTRGISGYDRNLDELIHSFGETDILASIICLLT
ncbi:flagellin lysine-N-methylase [Lachnospiraceae bacterium ZAX-1]